MKVLGHDDIGGDHEFIGLAKLLQHFEENSSASRMVEQTTPTKTAARDEVHVVRAVKSLRPLGTKVRIRCAKRTGAQNLSNSSRKILFWEDPPAHPFAKNAKGWGTRRQQSSESAPLRSQGRMQSVADVQQI